jgi:hypothetical protein
MSIFIIIIIVCIFIYYITNSNSSKKNKTIAKAATDLIFPKGLEQCDRLVSKFENFTGNRYSKENIRSWVTLTASSFKFFADKSEDRIVSYIVRKSDNTLHLDDGKYLYSIVSKEVLFPVLNDNENDEFLTQLINVGYGNNNDGYDTDIIPGAFGEFGFVATNPIPVKGIMGGYTYLENLIFEDGTPITHERTGSVGTDNIENSIDCYKIFKEGVEKSIIYISPYHKKNSAIAPDGFKLK